MASRSSAPPSRDTHVDLMPFQILIVTSERVLLRQITEQLDRFQLTYKATESGEDALSLLRQHRFLLLLLDEQVSGGADCSLCQRIRKMPELEGVPILKLLRQASNEQVLQAYFRGADDTLELPLHGGLFMVKVSGWLTQWRRGKGRSSTSVLSTLPSAQAAPVAPSSAPSVATPPPSSPPASLADAMNPKSLKPGAMLAGRYRLLELIGQGGMGKVYRALDTHLMSDVALKAFVPSQAEFFGLDERFRREVQAMARFQHPNIIRVLDYHATKRLQFAVIELLPGGTLQQKLRRSSNQRIEPIEALQIIAALADAVDFMHQQQIIHRDLKPDNVMFGHAQQPVIIDFGSSLDEGLDAERLTPQGLLLGTPYYMAPEQIERPRDVDHRCDIYSLGVVLFELLTGELPFSSLPPHQAMLSVLQHGLGTPRAFLPTLPDAIEELCLRAIAHKPEQRFSTARELQDACQHTIASVLLEQAIEPV